MRYTYQSAKKSLKSRDKQLQTIFVQSSTIYQFMELPIGCNSRDKDITDWNIAVDLQNKWPVTAWVIYAFCSFDGAAPSIAIF